MAQIFKPGANTMATVSLLGAAVTVFVIFAGGSGLTRSPYNTRVGNPIDQPVPFSHKHHVNELGIDCRFCHHTVEESPVASVPSTDVCMTCHSQVWAQNPLLAPVRESEATGTPIEWNKVNVLPDFVYFDHSIHVAKGVSCNTCHGQIQEMQITSKEKTLHMSWCLDCHRDPEKFIVPIESSEDGETLTPREQVFEIYRKLAAGESLSDAEYRVAMSQPEKAPKDANHKMVQERDINISHLEDCYICHR
jgi:hypothetical protein